MNNNFEINITNPLSKFKRFFEQSDRMILSAKFGDGKSYFLKKFMEEDDPKDPKYYFIVLHPVNYVVEENRDIFEYIKRDIIFQMLQDEKLFDFEDDFDTWDKAIINNIFFSEIYDFLLSIQPFAEAKVVGKLIKSGAEKFLKIRNTYNDLKNRPYNYVDSFALHKGSLAECDGFTQLIQQALKHIEEQYRRKTVLIIEDMDRLDPGHLFRILNVLGAQIDNPYFESDKQTGNEVNPNKFGFSKIVLVMDYKTTEHIFHHFYGKEANYEGYMQKFIDIEPFTFSFREEAETMLRKKLEDVCYINDNFLIVGFQIRGEQQSLLSCTNKFSVRRCKQLICKDVDLFIRKDATSNKFLRTLRVICYFKLILPAEISLHEIYKCFEADIPSFIDVMYPVIRFKRKIDNNEYTVKNGNNFLHFEYDEGTQKSNKIERDGYITNILDAIQIKDIWVEEEDMVLSYINFE